MKIWPPKFVQIPQPYSYMGIRSNGNKQRIRFIEVRIINCGIHIPTTHLMFGRLCFFDWILYGPSDSLSLKFSFLNFDRHVFTTSQALKPV